MVPEKEEGHMRTAFRAALTAAAITTTATAALADPVSVPERLMGDLQADLDLADFQAAGIVGNLARETGNFQFLRELNPIVPGSRGGIGYAQWTGPRHDAFLKFAGGADPMSYEVNYAFLIEELEGPYVRVLDRLRETETLDEATEVFMRGYLAPHPSHLHLEERVAFAARYMAGDFAHAGCASVHRVYEAGNVEVLQECPRDLAELRPRARPEKVAPTALDEASALRPRSRPEGLNRSGPAREVSPDQLVSNIEVKDPFATDSPGPGV
jgi:hypothetical protein